MQLFTCLVVLHAVKSKVAVIKILKSMVNDYFFSSNFPVKNTVLFSLISS